MPGRVVKLAAAVVDAVVGLRDCCLIQRRQSEAIDQSGIIASDSQYCTATLGGCRANLGMEVIESGLLDSADCTFNSLTKAVLERFSVLALRFGPLTFAASAPSEAKAGKNCRRRFVAQLETISSSLPIALSPSLPSWVVARPLSGLTFTACLS